MGTPINFERYCGCPEVAVSEVAVEYFADSDTQFLVYGRWEDADLQEGLKVLLTQFDGDHPGLLGRIHVFGLLDHGGPRWREPATAASFKLLVKRILAIA